LGAELEFMAHRLEIFRHTSAVIHLDHLEQNYRSLKAIVGDEVFFCPMVKANAYGHGDIEIALKLESLGVKTLGVGLIEEGLLLRQMGVKCELLVFGIFDAKAVREVVNWNMTPVLSVWQQIEALESSQFIKSNRKIPIHLKFDTGMHRLGFSVGDAARLLEKLENHPRLELKGICTHLHSGDDAIDLQGDSIAQLIRFQEVEAIFAHLNLQSHTLNSAGTINFHLLRQKKQPLPYGIPLNQGIRPGLLIYGVNPLDSGLLSEFTLKPVMSLRSHIVRYHRLQAGEAVSYGATWKASKNSVVGVIPIGYADGYHRTLSNRAEVLVKGRRVPQVGNVCMDYIMVDVTGIMTDVEIDNNLEVEATLFGYDSEGHLLNACELAERAQTIPWEILTSVGERVPRVIQGERVTQTKNSREARA
jgi:alanine racemase